MGGIIDEMKLLVDQLDREKELVTEERGERVKAQVAAEEWRRRAERAERALAELRHAMRAGKCNVPHCGQPVFNGHHCVAGHIQIRR